MDEKRYTLGQLIKRLRPFLRPYLPKYLAAVTLLISTSLLSLLPPYVMKVLIDNGIQAGNVAILNLMALALILIAILSGASRWVMEYLHEWISARFIADLRGHVLAHILSLPMSFFSSVKTGDILGRLRTDITTVYGVLVNTFLASLSEVIQILGITAFLFYLNIKLALIALSFVPPLYLLFIYFGRTLRRLTHVVRRKDVGLIDFFQERITNIQLLKLYHRESYEERNHRKLSDDLISSTLKSVRYKFISVFLISLLTSGAGVLVMWYGGYSVIRSGLSFGSLFAFYLYTLRLYSPIQSLANRGVEIYNGLASAERLVEYLDLKPDILEVENPHRPARFKGAIAFNDISFGYRRNQSPILQNVSLQIEPGQKVALVGLSGAGKTTLVNLLGRLYEVNSGSIQIDGYDIRELAFDSLYESIGVIPQEAFLFNDTIEENIRYGRIEATTEEVIEAAKKAHLHEFIQQLPNGYKTVIGPRGAKLSGGQRQRLAIARLILKDAPIWVLDEFTSSLDSRSESIVYENLIPLLREKTVLIIAHRLSTILSADLVVVLHNSQIVEAGTHNDLYERNRLYKRLFDSQFWHGGPLLESGPNGSDKAPLEKGESILVSSSTTN